MKSQGTNSLIDDERHFHPKLLKQSGRILSGEKAGRAAEDFELLNIDHRIIYGLSQVQLEKELVRGNAGRQVLFAGDEVELDVIHFAELTQ